MLEVRLIYFAGDGVFFCIDEDGGFWWMEGSFEATISFPGCFTVLEGQAGLCRARLARNFVAGHVWKQANLASVHPSPPTIVYHHPQPRQR